MFGDRRALRPRTLIALILTITVAPLATLLWLGWRLLEQDRILESQRSQERIERAADLVTNALQRALASSEQRLASGADDWPEGAVSVVIGGDRMDALPKARVAFFPVVLPLPEARAEAFAEGEELEFRKKDPATAINVFLSLTKSAESPTRAGALLRFGRTLAAAGRIDEALAAYSELASIDSAAIAGVPASLVGRYAQCELLERSHRTAQLATEARAFANDLKSGRWTLTAPVYSLYVADVAKWTGDHSFNNVDSELFAEAASQVWERRTSFAPRGNQEVEVAGRKVVLVWQRSGDQLRALIATPAFVQAQWFAAASSVAQEQRVTFGIGASGRDRSVVRTIRQTELPWSVTIVAGQTPEAGEFASRRRMLIAGFVLLVVMALSASYLIIRAVNRELEVARLQSDFVAAVSHEFRTPLTALRQFTDMLRDNERVSQEEGRERRLVCYDAQSRATDRLTKLVESLLDFGRMESGVHRYRFERRDCTEFVKRLVDEFRNEVQPSGYRVAFQGDAAAPVELDSEALGRAVRNLLDNAVKYSPDRRDLEVAVHRRNGHVRIDVRDYGIGVPANERELIFAKFQRGDQARQRGIKGTGIGLAMAAEIAKAHRGAVEVESEPGEGSTFTIVLPVV
jgi:two-component system phosphate regulon sensor histidine kinase PhoR